MANIQKATSKQDFLRSEKGKDLRAQLVEMVNNPAYNTHVVSILDADHMRFVEKHITYMSNHLAMDHSQYIMNLKLMTKLKSLSR